MRRIAKSSFLWQFAIGFALGAVGFVSLQPADATHLPFVPGHAPR